MIPGIFHRMQVPEFQDAISSIWEKIKESFDPKETTKPLNDFDEIRDHHYWLIKVNEIQRHLSAFRNQHYCVNSKAPLGNQCRGGLEVSDGGAPIYLEYILGVKDHLGWDKVLESKQVGESISMSVRVPVLPLQHPLNGWSGAPKKLTLKIVKVEEPPFRVFSLPGKDISWDLVNQSIPYAIYNCCQQIPWDLTSKLLLDLEERKWDREDYDPDPLWKMTLDLLDYQFHHPIRIREWISWGMKKIKSNDAEVRCRFFSEMISTALSDTNRVKPHDQFRQICKVLVEEFGQALDWIISEYLSSVQSIGQKFSSDGTLSISMPWCKTRQEILSTKLRFLDWLSKSPSFSLVIRSRKKSWEHLLEEIKTIQESLSFYISGNELPNNLESKGISEEYLNWLKSRTQNRIKTDCQYLKKLRKEDDPLPLPIVAKSPPVSEEIIEPLKLIETDQIQRLTKRLSRIAVGAYPDTSDWPKPKENFDETIEYFLMTLGKMGVILDQLDQRLHAEPALSGLKKRTVDFHWSFDSNEKDNRNINDEDMDIITPLSAISYPQKTTALELRTAWGALSKLSQSCLLSLIDGVPTMGCLLQHILAIGKIGNERTNFHLPLLWAILSKHLDSYRREGLDWLKQCSEATKKMKMNQSAMEAALRKIFSAIVLDELLRDMHQTMVQSFWSTYREVATMIQRDDVINPNAQRVLRGFLRHGLLFNHPGIISPDRYRKLIQACPTKSREVKSAQDLGMVIYADDLLTLVFRGDLPGSLSFEKELEFESNPDLKRKDRVRRRSWRLAMQKEKVSHYIKRQERLLMRQLEQKRDSNTIRERKKELKKAKRILLDLEYRRQELGDAFLEDFQQETILDYEVQFIRQQSKSISGKKEKFLPFAVMNGYRKEEFCWDRKGCLAELSDLQKRYSQAFDLQIRGYKAKLELNIIPLTILVPANGISGNCVQARSPSDLGRIVLPVFRDPSQDFQNILINAMGAFRFDSDREQGKLEDAQSLLAQYTAYRWECLHKKSEIYEKEGFYKKMSDRYNFRYHFHLFFSSEGGKRLRLKSTKLHEMFSRKLKFKEKPSGKIEDPIAPTEPSLSDGVGPS